MTDAMTSLYTLYDESLRDSLFSLFPTYQAQWIHARDAAVCSAPSQTRGRLPLSGSTLMTIWKVSQGVQKSNLIINKSLQENQRK